MDESFDNPGLLERISLIIAIAFIPLSIISAFIYPVQGFPLWGKGIMAGLVFLGIYASCRKRRRDSGLRGRDTSHTPPGRSNEHASRAPVDRDDEDASARNLR